MTGGLALRDGLQPPAARLHALAVDPRGALVPAGGAVLAGVVDVDDVEGVDVAGDIPMKKKGEEMISSKIHSWLRGFVVVVVVVCWKL